MDRESIFSRGGNMSSMMDISQEMYDFLEKERNKKMQRSLIMASPEIPISLLSSAKLLPNRLELIKMLPKNTIVTEVGVAFGDFSNLILNTMQPTKFVAIDIFRLHEEVVYGGMQYSGVLNKEKFKGLNHFDWYSKRFEKNLNNGQLEIKKGISWEILRSYPDRYFDMIYIDADHRYESVKKDIQAAKRKIKNKGVIIFNDYVLFDLTISYFYGVPKAVNEFLLESNFKVFAFAFHPYMLCDLAVKCEW